MNIDLGRAQCRLSQREDEKYMFFLMSLWSRSQARLTNQLDRGKVLIKQTDQGCQQKSCGLYSAHYNLLVG